MKNSAVKWIILSITLAIACPLALADVTSPQIKDKGKKYTTEKADSGWYGTSSSARLVEASELRIHVENMLANGEWEKAIPKAKKAVQLDPGDPQGHIYLARALTMKFYQTKGEPDEKLLQECMLEWDLIRRHDADPSEQWEAGTEVKKLVKIAKAIEKDKIRREKEKLERGDSQVADSGATGATVKLKTASSSGAQVTEDDNKDSKKGAQKKSRWRMMF